MLGYLVKNTVLLFIIGIDDIEIGTDLWMAKISRYKDKIGTIMILLHLYSYSNQVCVFDLLIMVRMLLWKWTCDGMSNREFVSKGN